MTDTDVILMIGCIILLSFYAAWLWDEYNNTYTESQDEASQAHKTTSNKGISSNETKKQQEAR